VDSVRYPRFDLLGDLDSDLPSSHESIRLLMRSVSIGSPALAAYGEIREIFHLHLVGYGTEMKRPRGGSACRVRSQRESVPPRLQSAAECSCHCTRALRLVEPAWQPLLPTAKCKVSEYRVHLPAQSIQR
jgi:hypothetical protein